MDRLINFNKSKYTFEKFLSGIPARDYVFQDTDYNGQIKQAKNIIEESNYILIGAGADMSKQGDSPDFEYWRQMRECAARSI